MTKIRSSLVDNSIKKHFDELVSKRCLFQLGILIGSCSIETILDSIYACVVIPTEKDDKNSTLLEEMSSSWVLEYSNQIERLLPGGISIVGLYIIIPQSNSDMILRIQKQYNALFDHKDKISYVFHLCPHSNQLISKTILNNTISSVGIKWQISPFKFSSYSSFLSVDICFPLKKYKTNIENLTIKDVKEQLLCNKKNGEVELNRILAVLDDAIGVVVKENGKNLINLFLKQTSDFFLSKNRNNSICIKGEVYCLAFIEEKSINKEEKAIQAIKDDYRKTILDRINTLYEDWENLVEDSSDEDIKEIISSIPFIHGGITNLPIRGTFKWCGIGSNSFDCSIYLFNDETIEEASKRTISLLALPDEKKDIKLKLMESIKLNEEKLMEKSKDMKKSQLPIILLSIVVLFLSFFIAYVVSKD